MRLGSELQIAKGCGAVSYIDGESDSTESGIDKRTVAVKA